MSILGIAYQQLRFRPAQRGSQTHSGLRIAPVGISALLASVGSQPRLSYVPQEYYQSVSSYLR